MALTVFDPNTDPLTGLLQGFLASNSGIHVVDGSISLRCSGPGAVSLYDAAVGSPLGIGSGLLLTSGITPGTSNTSTWYGADNSGSSGFYNGDADIDAVVNTVFHTQSYDATTLAFSFNLSDPAATSISFDLVFGSDEYPEWVDAFVDCAVVIVDGVNYALFNNDPLHPLSVVSSNLAAGYFQDNAGKILPIEYDGVSGKLTIVAPLNTSLTTHSIKIGIADTGDHILDSGLFIANMSAGTNPGSGVVSNPGGGSSGNDNCSGSSKDEYFDLKEGDDTVYAGGGADIIVAGSGCDQIFAGSGNDDIKGDAGDDLLDGGADLDTAVYAGPSSAYADTLTYDAAKDTYSINGTSQGEGIDCLMGIEQLKFSDGLFTLSANGTSAKLTAVNQPPPPPANGTGLVMISGLAAVGSTLTATLADPDGLPSAAGAISWQWHSDLGAITGATASTYKVQVGDSDHSIWVDVAYTDAKGNSESPTSSSVFVQPLSTDGELTATLMTIEGPESASVNTPLTTLLLRAVELGEGPYSAIQKIRAALGVPATVGSLLTTNAFQILQAGAGDQASALALARLEVQVAILCSVSDDQSGLKLALALLNIAASGGSCDLTNAADVAEILGLDPATFEINDKDTWPKTLQEVIDRTNNIADADRLLETSPGSGKSMESEWMDFLSNWDDLADTVPLTSLSLAINQGPSGFASAELPSLLAGEEGAYLLTTTQLIEGFQDPDNDPLSVSGLTTDHGDWFLDNGDGTWSINQNASGYDPSYVGPLELSYTLDDGHGHSLDANQLLLVVEHLNHDPTGTVTINNLVPSQGQVLTASHTLADLDGIPTSGAGAISYQWQADGSAISGATGSTYTLTQADVGKAISVTASYIDNQNTAESVTSMATAAVANVNDLPTGTVTINNLVPSQGQVLTASHTLADLDGIPTSGAGAISYQWQADGSAISGATGSTYTLTQADVGKAISVTASYIDNQNTAESVTSMATAAVANVNDLATGTVTINNLAPSQGQMLSASHTLADLDGIPTSGAGAITYQWKAGGTPISGATGSTYTLTQAEAGKTITVTASYTDNHGTPESVTSMATEAVAAAPADSTPPTLSSISLSDAVVTLTFSEPISAASLSTTAFQVAIISASLKATNTPILSVTSVNATPTQLLLNLQSKPASSSNLRITYTDPIGDQASGVVQDLTGNDMAQIGTSPARYATTFSSAITVSSLASEYLNLNLTGTSAINGTGNSKNNVINGNSAANILNGGAGNDTMAGGAGNDIYVVDSSSDVITELANGGIDLVRSSVSFSLASFSELDNLTLLGSGAINGTGNLLNNSITGNSAENTLSGENGNDTLNGSLGIDTLTGGGGNDTFHFDSTPGTTNRDQITDFSSGIDKLSFSKRVFAGFSSSAKTVTTAQFASSAGLMAATTTSQRFLYDTTSGILRYDRDGSGSSYAALEVAVLGSTTHPTLMSTDFVLG